MLTSGQPTHHLNEIDQEPNEMLDLLIKQMAKAHLFFGPVDGTVF